MDQSAKITIWGLATGVFTSAALTSVAYALRIGTRAGRLALILSLLGFFYALIQLVRLLTGKDGGKLFAGWSHVRMLALSAGIALVIGFVAFEVFPAPDGNGARTSTTLKSDNTDLTFNFASPPPPSARPSPSKTPPETPPARPQAAPPPDSRRAAAQGASVLPGTCQPQRPALAAAIAELTPTVGRARIRICRDGVDCSAGPIKLGSNVQFEIESDVPGRAVVVDLDSKGMETRLVPDTQFNGLREALVGPTQALRIPDPDADVKTQALEVGRGCILVMVTPEGGSAAQYVVGEVAATKGFGNVPATHLGELARGARKADPTMGGWAFGFVSYRVIP